MGQEIVYWEASVAAQAQKPQHSGGQRQDLHKAQAWNPTFGYFVGSFFFHPFSPLVLGGKEKG